MAPSDPGPETALLSEEVLAELQQGPAGLKDRERPSRQRPPPSLDGIIDGVLDRGHQALGDDALRSLVLHLAVVHQPPVPDDLPDRMVACVGCRPDRGAGGAGSGGGTRARAAGPRMGTRQFAGLGWAAIGAGLRGLRGLRAAGLWPGLATLGLFWPAMALHNIGLLLAPVMMWLLWSQYRRHGHRSIVVLGLAARAC